MSLYNLVCIAILSYDTIISMNYKNVFMVCALVFELFAPRVSANRSTDSEDLTTPIDNAATFFEWLEKNAKEFGSCEPTKRGRLYLLCDGTTVPQDDLLTLFSRNPSELISDLNQRGLKIEILCDSNVASSKAEFNNVCSKTTSRKTFSEIKSTHGQYLPEEKTALLRSSATRGSLIHEYLHHLQSSNQNPIRGHIYKQERNEIQRSLIQLMEKTTLRITDARLKGDKAGLQYNLKIFGLAADTLRGFAPWQDLIDERPIFLLYLKYGKDFGATQEDLDLARKNMSFICKNPKLKPVLPNVQCQY